MFFVFRCLVPPLFFAFLIFKTTLGKSCGNNQKRPLPPIINVVLGHAVQGAQGQHHRNWRKGYFQM